jgi:uncharacterized protein
VNNKNDYQKRLIHNPKHTAMTLFDRINEDIKTAMLARDKDKLESLRAIKAAFLVAKTEKGHADILSEEAELKIIQKLVKQREESAAIYKEQNRDDLYQKEVIEAKYISAYLPAGVDEATVVEELKRIISDTGAKSAADFGKVMGMAVKKFAGRADNKVISAKLKELLP